MVARTTYAALAKIIEVDAVITADAAAFIDTATALVDRMGADAEDGSGNPFWDDTVDAVMLELIERWLAGHFYAVRDPRYGSEGSSSSQTSYLTKIGMYLSLTHEGQQALLLDTSGWLSALSKKAEGRGKRVGVFWAGTGFGNEPSTGTASGA